jgi:hypothetical protein
MKYLLITTPVFAISPTPQSVADKLNALMKEKRLSVQWSKQNCSWSTCSQNPIKTMAGQRQFLSLFISLPLMMQQPNTTGKFEPI